MGVSLTPTQVSDIKLDIKAVTDIVNNLAAVNLTKPERQAIQGVAEERLPFVQMAFDTLIDGNPNMQPPFSDLTAAKADYTYMVQLRDLRLQLLQLQEILSDHELAAGSLAFEYMRDFYDVARRAAERNVPGADTVVDALSPLFEVTNQQPPLPGGVG